MFHNLCDMIKEELSEIDRKAAKGQLTMQEVDYADKLAHLKKSLLTVDAMENPEEYWDDGHRYGARRRDSMGRYRDSSMMDSLHDLMRKAPDDRTRRKFEEFISEMEKMG